MSMVPMATNKILLQLVSIAERERKKKNNLQIQELANHDFVLSSWKLARVQLLAMMTFYRS